MIQLITNSSSSDSSSYYPFNLVPLSSREFLESIINPVLNELSLWRLALRATLPGRKRLSRRPLN